MIGKYPRSLTGAHKREYKIWLNMLDRCKRESIHKRQPSYKDCTVSNQFLDFDYFVDWCNSQIGFGLPDAQLDKDVLKRGNTVYGPETCVFLPRELNQIVVSRAAKRGQWPVGVSLVPGKSDKWQAQCNRGLRTRSLGTFDCPEKAFEAYKQAKEARVKSVADKYYGKIDNKAYIALMQYQVSKND